MSNPFENYTFEQANEIFNPLKISLEERKTSREFVKGNDWQDGKGWVGPHFEGKGEVNDFLKAEVKRDFTSKGDIRSIVRRHRRGVIGKMPGWQISSRNAPSDPTAAPDETDKELIGEAQKIFNEFWKHSRVHPTLNSFIIDFDSLGHAILRLFFVQNPEGETETAKTIEDAVKMIHLFKEEPEAGCVVLDKETLKRASFFRYEKGGNVYIEVCYIDDDGETVFKKLSKDGTKDFTDQNFPTSIGKYNNGAIPEDNEPLTLPLNGQLLVFEMKGEPLVSPSMCSQQKLANKGYTMMSHNLDMDGFRAKKILNGLPPGEFKDDPATKKKVFIPDEKEEKVGAGVVSYIQGLPVIEKDSDKGTVKTTYTTPSVHESQPVDIKTFVESIRTATEAMLEEADQKHIAISGDATSSGESRIQAQNDYKGSLEDTKSLFDDVMSDVFETVLAVVAYLMGKPDRYKDLQVSFNAILNVGPKSIEERRVAREEANERYRSNESAMEEMNITDPDAMKAKIEQENEENPEPDKVPPKTEE